MSGSFDLSLGLGWRNISRRRAHGGASATPVDGGGGGGVPAWVQALAAPSSDTPTDALLFQSAQYWSGAAEQPIADLLGGAFDPSAISASGMEVSDSNSNRPSGIGDFATSCLAVESTFVVEVQITGFDPEQPAGLVLTQSAADAGNGNLVLYWYPEDETDVVWAACNQSWGSFDELGLGIGNAVWKIAVTTKPNGDVVSSFGGAAVHTDVASDVPVVATKLWLGWQEDGEGAPIFPMQGFIRSVVRYDPQPDADLPALST